MVTTTVSSRFCTGVLSLSTPRSSQRKLDFGSRYENAHFGRSKRSVIIKAGVPSNTDERVLHNTELSPLPSADFCKGWTDANVIPAQRNTSHLESLAVLISDRVEMHAILAVQRDNWHHLFHSTITISSISAAVASAVNGTGPASGLQVVSIILGMGAAALIALVSKFQPSQLAEEQRHAARFFKRLGADIKNTLQVDPRLREDASTYLQRQVGTLHALDKAFPLPLTPVLVEKFPKHVRPSKLSGDLLDLSKPESKQSWPQLQSNRWTSSIVDDLKHIALLLHTSDIPEYVAMANSAKNLNLVLAIISPVFATAGVVLNMAVCPSVAAAVTVGSLFFHTLTHGLQMGAVYEVYRNCAGYYAAVKESIEEVLRLPVHKREDSAIFSAKIAMLLGRAPSAVSIVPDSDRKAGTLF